MDQLITIINSIEPLYLSIVFIIIIIINVFLYRSLLSCVKNYPSSLTDYETEEKNFKVYIIAALAGIIANIRLLYTYYINYDGDEFTSSLIVVLVLAYMTIGFVVHNKIKVNIKVHVIEKIIKERQDEKLKALGFKNN